MSPARLGFETEEVITKEEGAGREDRFEITHYRRVVKRDQIVTESPVDLIVTAPDGRVVDRNVREVPGMYYHECDIEGNGELNDIVTITRRRSGPYRIVVRPGAGASSSDVFTLKAITEGCVALLAEEVQIQDIPGQPYLFISKFHRSDLNEDDEITLVDMEILSSVWLDTECAYPWWCTEADLNYDGCVDMGDFRILAREWRATKGAAWWETPVAHWRFDEGSGNTASDSAGTNRGTVYGAVWTTGRIGGALSFDGTDDYVDCGDADVLAPEQMTLALWVYAEGDPTNQYILGKAINMAPARDYTISTDGAGKLTFYFGEDDPSKRREVKAGSTLPTSRWIHVAVTRDGSTASLYVNGAHDNSDAYSFTPVDKGHGLRIGSVGTSGGWAGYFKGKIDDVRLYEVALSDEDIQTLYSQVSE